MSKPYNLQIWSYFTFNFFLITVTHPFWHWQFDMTESKTNTINLFYITKTILNKFCFIDYKTHYSLHI